MALKRIVRFTNREPAIEHHGLVRRGDYKMLRTILFIFVILLLFGALPAWPYSAGWGYYPSGGLGLLLIILIILVLADRL